MNAADKPRVLLPWLPLSLQQESLRRQGVRSKSELAELRKPVELDFRSRFFYAHNLPFRPDLSVVSNLLSYSETYRVRCEEQRDINALYEFIEICGEQALTAKWVLN